jgi:hypothetical protein
MAGWNLRPYFCSRANRAKTPGKRPTLGQVQMDAEIEGLRGIVQFGPRHGRGKSARDVFRQQDFPLLQRPEGVRGVGQERRAGEQTEPKPAQNAVTDGPVHSQVVGVEHETGAL